MLKAGIVRMINSNFLNHAKKSPSALKYKKLKSVAMTFKRIKAILIKAKPINAISYDYFYESPVQNMGIY
ncbi:hypothetical protein [Acinetobacter terrae]|uniref:Transposase n=1 Tax=Acinetobacter terrae TaxID=2731247 RepID=A0ABX1V4W0_9GAMM|nr:hypothetical protein [Acinetobacter terrae]NNH88144.1 hypothetical protein [Acinetobacter terrae]